MFTGEDYTEEELQPSNGRGRSPRIPADREPRKPPNPTPDEKPKEPEWPDRPGPDEQDPWD